LIIRTVDPVILRLEDVKLQNGIIQYQIVQ
jgi:hypothetical protein